MKEICLLGVQMTIKSRYGGIQGIGQTTDKGHFLYLEVYEFKRSCRIIV